MPRSRRTGLNVVRKKRSDGSVIEYFYDRATKKFLGHTREAALERLSFQDPVTEAGIVPGSIAALIVDYLGDEEVQGRLRESTRRLYRGYLDRMRDDWGDIPARAITRQEVKAIKKRMRGTPRKANQILSLLQILLARAKEQGIVTENVAERFGRLHIASRVQIWSYEMEDAFLVRARPSLQLAYMLLLYTVQRPSDVLSMDASRISERDGRLFIALQQSKTGTLLDVPVHERLAGMLRERMRQIEREAISSPVNLVGRIGRQSPKLLVPSPTGKKWARRNFCRAWDQIIARMAQGAARQLFREGFSKEEVREQLAESHRQRRDLRRTGIVRLAEAGATTPQIASISGHGIDYCQRIIDTYLPRRTEVAVAGMQLWEQHQQRETSKVVSIAATRGRLG
ncbi:tyrosine-type recombinase/integrase [Komagataeibacter sucrofermentans]|nr:tyrosine-type recombinase/integrase [Komagataeibacter sucrofermentans]GBQ46115.1 integrase [Komagataeibacter sucrofermentans DSM 15973]